MSKLMRYAELFHLPGAEVLAEDVRTAAAMHHKRRQVSLRALGGAEHPYVDPRQESFHAQFEVGLVGKSPRIVPPHKPITVWYVVKRLQHREGCAPDGGPLRIGSGQVKTINVRDGLIPYVLPCWAFYSVFTTSCYALVPKVDRVHPGHVHLNEPESQVVVRGGHGLVAGLVPASLGAHDVMVVESGMRC